MPDIVTVNMDSNPSVSGVSNSANSNLNYKGDYFELVERYTKQLNRVYFFWRGFSSPLKYGHQIHDYHKPVDTQYFNEAIWQNVGQYLYKGMRDLEHDEPQTQGTQAKLLGQATAK